MKKTITLIILLISTLVTINAKEQSPKELSVSYEQYKLKNGMDVILHQDKSDPIVAVAVQYHVGSNREVPGKTGFAHLFEHMMFQQSENVPQDGFFKLIQGAGGTINGGTGNDGTFYYEVVPKNALELVLWMESDRMGYLENTVTQSALSNQQNVVQNEKRQTSDNRPYGYKSWVTAKNLYPAGHPYSWTVIGEMEDLRNATVDDVKEFHRKYYVPNNTTLVLAGDFEFNEVKPLIEKYFGEIPAGEKVTDLTPEMAELIATKKLYHEDNLARTPELTMIWPTPEQFTKDACALDFLAKILAKNKKSPFYRVVVKDKKLASSTNVYNSSMELAGQFTVSVNASANINLTEVEKAVFEAFRLFEEEGVSELDLEKQKAGIETEFYNKISSVLGKAYQLARYNEYAGSPDFIEQEIANIRAVTAGDIMRVYKTYIKDKPYLSMSFAPKGQLELVVENSENAGIVEEQIENASKVETTENDVKTEFVKTPCSFDRSVQPEPGAAPALKIPKPWTTETSNGIKVHGINRSEVPLISYTITIEGGHLQEPLEKAGTANLLANLLMAGTASKTPEELEEAIELLGAGIKVVGGREDITIDVNCLSRNFEKTLALVEEILLHPRWDQEQFDLLKMKTINELNRNLSNPNWQAALCFFKLIYGENSIICVPPQGTPQSVESMTIDDLKDFYTKNLSPSVTKMQIAGDIDKKRVMAALQDISNHWKSKEVKLLKPEIPQLPEKGAIYFVDIPGSKQSVIYAGNVSVNRYEEYPATVMNYKLGGAFNSKLNMILREEKGFTYGIRSGFSGFKNYGNFSVNTSVRSDATFESVSIIKSEIEKYMEGISDEDLAFTKDALLKSKVRDFETLGGLQRMLQDIGSYNLPFDFVKQEEEFVLGYTPEKHLELAKKLLKPSQMYFLVAGDAETQMAALEKLGLGTPILYKP